MDINERPDSPIFCEPLKITFILPPECEDINSAPTNMLSAYNKCESHSLTPVCIKESDNVDLRNPRSLVFICHQFKGKLFDQLLEARTIILSAICFMHCLKEKILIPRRHVPMMSIALLDCIVVLSGMCKEEKAKFINKIEFMGGTVSLPLVEQTTYLVTSTVKSDKYSVAVKHNIKVMTPDFINELWQLSKTEYILASDPRFEKFTCPILYMLKISSTGFPASSNTLPDLVKQHGGEYSGRMIVAQTDILVCNTTTSEKYKMAIKYEIDCVTERWIHDSISKGYALSNFSDYAPNAKKTSTPTKQAEPVDPNFSCISAISQQITKSVCEETMNQTSVTNRENLRKQKDSEVENYNQIVDQLDVKKAKLCGPFLDGCMIFVIGFSQKHNEKLCKILNFSGATRCETLSDAITHIIVGDSRSSEMRQLKDVQLPCPLLNVKWLVDSMEAKKPLQPEIYLIQNSHTSDDMNSPMSKKGLSLLRANVSSLSQHKEQEALPSTSRQQDEVQEDVNDIMKCYLNPGPSHGRDELVQVLENIALHNNENVQANHNDPEETANTEDIGGAIFDKLKFAVVNYPEAAAVHIITEIQNYKGEIVPRTYKGIPDYVVVPINSGNLHVTATNVVTHLWLEDCITHMKLITDLEYYHLPFPTSNPEALDGLVITLSGLPSNEKEFLSYIINDLGGVQQDCLARNADASKAVLASTHLISAEASGKKYLGALKWGLPIVDKAWLMKCATDNKRIDEFDFLIGESKEQFASKRSNERENIAPVSIKSAVVQSVSAKLDQSVSAKLDQSVSAKLNQSVAAELSQRVSTELDGEIPHNSNFSTRNSQFASPLPIAHNSSMRNFESPANCSFSNSRDSIATPETPYGRCFEDPPKPAERKKWAKMLQKLPSPKRRLSTPLSEIKRRYWTGIHTGSTPVNNSGDEVDALRNEQDNMSQETMNSSKRLQFEENSERPLTQNALEMFDKLENAIKRYSETPKPPRVSMKRVEPETEPGRFDNSQKLDVAWDFNADYCSRTARDSDKPKIFMISGLEPDERINMMKQLETLGASLSALNNHDPASTHLICPSLKRNEKTLAAMASGLWILHHSYVEESAKAGKFLEEDDFEFGNSHINKKFKLDGDEEQRAQASHFWRKEIWRRGYGAFNDFRAIIVAQRKEPMVRVLQAGGAIVVEAEPPFDENVSATHCFIELRSANFRDYIPLAKRGIKCLNTLYVNDFLMRTANNINDYLVPGLSKYY